MSYILEFIGIFATISGIAFLFFGFYKNGIFVKKGRYKYLFAICFIVSLVLQVLSRLIFNSPEIEYGFISEEAVYDNNIQVHGVNWNERYSFHTLILQNKSEIDMKNVVMSISLPAAIVRYFVVSSVNTYGIVFSQNNSEVGVAFKQNKITKTDQWLLNCIDISIEKINKNAGLSIGFVLDYRKCNGNWFFDIAYEFGNDSESNRIINPIEILSETPFVIKLDRKKDLINKKDILNSMEIYPAIPDSSNMEAFGIDWEIDTKKK